MSRLALALKCVTGAALLALVAAQAVDPDTANGALRQSIAELPTTETQHSQPTTTTPNTADPNSDIDQTQTAARPNTATTTLSLPAIGAAPGDACAPTRPLIAPPLVRSGPTDKPRVAITIDDTFGAIGGRSVAAALDLADAKGAKLTFFPTGGALDDHDKAGIASVWRRVIAEGDEVGNHTYSHANLLKLTDKDIQDELDSTQGRIDQIVGFHYEMHFMRPPGGNGGFPSRGPDPNGDRVRCVVQRLGYSMAMWTIDNYKTRGFNDYLNHLLAPSAVSNGSIVLLHFTTFSIDNLAVLIDALTTRGLQLVTLSELFS